MMKTVPDWNVMLAMLLQARPLTIIARSGHRVLSNEYLSTPTTKRDVVPLGDDGGNRQCACKSVTIRTGRFVDSAQLFSVFGRCFGSVGLNISRLVEGPSMLACNFVNR